MHELGVDFYLLCHFSCYTWITIELCLFVEDVNFLHKNASQVKVF